MKQLDPKAVVLFFINFILLLFIPVIFLTVYTILSLNDEISFDGDVGSLFFGPAIFAILVLVAICFVWAKLSYRFYRYELTDSGFRKESGVIYKRYVTIPYNRIQNVDIYRGIWARILGLSDLQIQTAGASAVMSGRYGTAGVGSEGRLPGVSKETAEQLRDELIRRAQNNQAQGL